MPHTKSAKKTLKQSTVRRASNRATKAVIRNTAKKVQAEIAAKDAPAATETLRALTRKLDKSVAKKVLHKNTASRIKSRMSAAILRVKKAAAAAV